MLGPLACMLLSTAGLAGYLCPPQPRIGYLWQPAFALDALQRAPAIPYQPQPGDLLIFNCAERWWKSSYRLALTSPPTHSAIVVSLADGKPALLEAGIGFQLFVEITPLEERLTGYNGDIYVRRRTLPLTEVESARLADFASAVHKKSVPPGRFLIQVTPLRARGPLRTEYASGPQGVRRGYMCSELVVETLVATGLLDAEIARPTATFPRDFFYERSTNPYLNRTLIPTLSAGWEPPALWTRD